MQLVLVLVLLLVVVWDLGPEKQPILISYIRTCYHVILSVIDLKCLYVELEHLFCNLICIVIYLLIK